MRKSPPNHSVICETPGTDYDVKVDELLKRSQEVIEKSEAVVNRVEIAEKSVEGKLLELQETAKAIAKDETAASPETLKQAVTDIMAEQQRSTIREGRITAAQQQQLRLLDPWQNKTEYFTYDLENPAGFFTKGVDGIRTLLAMPKIDDAHEALTRMAVDVQLMDALGRTICRNNKEHYPGFANMWPKTSAKWTHYLKVYSDHVGVSKAVGDAIDTSDLSNWVPTGWTSEVRELIMLRVVVPALFPRFTIPQGMGSIDMFLNLTDTECDFIGELTDLVNPLATTGDQASIQALNDAKKNWIPKKLRARMLISGEAVEDAAVAMLPLLRTQLVRLIANGEEKAIIDGQTGTAIDTNDAPTGLDVRLAFDGIRKFCDAATSYVDFSGTLTTSGLIKSMRLELGERGVDIGNMVYITGPAGYLQMLVLAETLTVDKFGDGAAVLRGQLGGLGGIPIVVSRYVREDLHTDGTVQAGSSSSTIVLLVRTDAFLIGEKRAVTVESDRHIQTDQYDVVAMERLDFGNIFGTSYKTAVSGHNIPNA